MMMLTAALLQPEKKNCLALTSVKQRQIFDEVCIWNVIMGVWLLTEKNCKSWKDIINSTFHLCTWRTSKYVWCY